MSTKCSLAWGEDFHFFRDLRDEDENDVHLRLDGKDFSWAASPDGITLRLPAHIWETIRKVGATDLSLVDKSDSDLQELVEKQVDERISEYQKASSSEKSFLCFAGSGVFGGADDPREEQIASGFRFYSDCRAKQLETVRKMQSHKVYLEDEVEGTT